MDKNIGKKLDGRYELLELIGVGGMADIYKAKDIAEDKIVAVKILKNEFSGSEDFLRRFRNESKAIALLSHPNIVKIFDVGFSERVQYIVMEFIDGITLTEYIESQGVLKWRDAVHFTLQILRALQHAHDRGIVHRDIKSQNVMLLSDGSIKVMDFGIARFNREADKTISEKAIGSVHYISPEQARGEMTDEKSDIYSVGVMLYEMLTGKKPFNGDNPVSIALMHMQSQPKRPTELNSSIPEGLEEIVIKAMQKEPSKRYQTAGEMIKDIEEFKKNPSIVFEYKYFSTDGSTKYFDKVSEPQKEERQPKKKALAVKTEEVDEEDEEDDEDEDETVQRRSPLLPILFAVASVFVIMSAWVIFQIVTTNISGIVQAGGEEAKMPSFIGMTWDEAQAQYPNLTFGTPIQENSSTYEKYVIMDQNVSAGRTIKTNQQIILTVSDGPKLVEIDDFADRHVDEVEAQLKRLGLTPVIKYDESDTVASEYVIKTEPAAHEQVETDTKVIVWTSMGAAETLTAVPDMLGMLESSAEARAKEYGILLTVVEETSPTVEKGRVIRQSVEPLTKVEKNTLVEITVSAGEFGDVREYTIPISLARSLEGKYVFEYYENSVLLEEKTETRNIGLDKKIDWVVSGNAVSTYAIYVTSDETGRSGLFVKLDIDFTGEEVTMNVIELNKSIFRDLLKDSEEETPTDEEDYEATIGDETEAADETAEAPVEETESPVDTEVPAEETTPAPEETTDADATPEETVPTETAAETTLETTTEAPLETPAEESASVPTEEQLSAD